MLVEILGTGCANCKRLEAQARQAAAEARLIPDFEKVTEMAAILGYGVISTPALVVDGRVVSSGRVPSSSEIAAWLREAATP